MELINISYIITGLISILIWQVIAIILWGIIELFNKNDPQESEEFALRFAICIPYFILKGIDSIGYHLILSWCKKHLCKYCLIGKVYWKDHTFTKEVKFFATKQKVKTLSFDDTKDYHVKFISDCTNIEGVPYGYKIYNGQKIFENWDMSLFKLSKEEIEMKKENT